MASLMDRDPWSWSVSDVTNFFMQRHANKAVIAEMPGVSLPPPETWTANFAEERMTGAVLLTAVDTEYLRRRLKIKTLGPRAAVMHCIEKLRAISPAYKRRNEPTVWTPPGGEPLQLSEEQLARLLQLPDPIGPLRELLAAKALVTVQETGEPMQLDEVQSTPANAIAPEPHVRPNETLTESKDGKKRRRLDLTVAVTNENVRDTVDRDDTDKVGRDNFELDDFERLLPARKLPVDEVFFGDTAVGEECGQMAIDHPLYIHEGSDDKDIDDQNFQYINPNIQVGAACYIASQLQRFMHTQEEVTTTRHQKHAVVVYPYRVGMQVQRTASPHYDRRGRILFPGTRSAMVVQHRVVAGTESDEPTYAVTRENEALIESGAGDKGYNQEQAAELAGEHDHLLLRYPDDERNLMSEDEDTVAGYDDDSSTEFGDDQAEEDDEEAILDSEVQETVGRAIEAHITAWQEDKLPRLETRRAWTVWKQTKHSKFLREELVQGARARIRELETRLLKARTDLESSSWESKASLNTMCAALQPTVEDIQHEHWKIEVWNRRQEPGRIRISTRKTTKKGAASAFDPLMLSQMPIDDRLSVEPRLQSSSPPPVPLDDEGDRFHTPRGSPAPEIEDSPFIVPDNDVDMDAADSPQATGNADVDMDSAEQGQGPEMIATSTPSVQRALSVKEGSATPNSRSGLPSMKTPSSATRFQNITSADMPSPSVLAQRYKNNSSPAPSLIDLTDLQSSPVGPTSSASVEPKAKNPKKRRGPGKDTLNNAPSISEADSWNYADLELNQDRSRLLIKLVRDMGPAKRNALWKTWQELMLRKFHNQLGSALDSLTSREATPPADGTPQMNDNPKVQIMKHCARLFLAFHFCRSDICCGDRELPNDLVNDNNKPGDGDMKNFVSRLRALLEKREMPMYSSPVPVKYEDPILIESDDDVLDQDIDADHLKQKGPTSARKRRKVERDLAAADKRSAARARMEESQNHRSSTPSALQQMVHSDLNVHTPGSKVINPMRKPDQDPIYIEQKIADAMKSYQLEGVQFLWRELTGDLDNAQGCLLAHTMGLGKTMQSIALLCAVDVASRSSSMNVVRQLPKDLRLGDEDRGKRSLRFLIICPPSLIQNWERELKQWAHPNAFGGSIIIVDTAKVGSDYIQKLQRWSKNGGVLLIGYQTFAKLALGDQSKKMPKDSTADDAQAQDELRTANSETARRILTHDAELVVADEAHTIKNPTTKGAIAASGIRSTARIALTGTPMSNDVDEIYSIISWVTPGFLGDKTQFNHFFGLPIKEGLYLDSTSYEKRRSTIKLKSLHYQIEPKVHRAGIEVLKGELKPKVEFVLTVELTQQQSDAYAGTVAALLGPDCDLDKTSNTTLFSWFGVLGLLTTHPRCFRQKLLTSKDAAKSKKAKSTGANDGQANDEDPGTGEADEDSSIPGDEPLFTLGFTRPIVDALIEGLTDSIDPALSAKTRLLREILRLSKKAGDKVLIFSARTATLDYLGTLCDMDKVRFVRIDGSVSMQKRTKLLSKFQDKNGGLDAMLISTRAGGQGLNIQSANRVIIFDFGFNPAWEEQAIGRSYRFGQEKPVFVYRFVAGGTYESNIYNTQMFKTSLASRIVDKRNPHRNAIRNTKQYLYPPKDVDHEDLTTELGLDLDPKVLSKIMQAQIDRGDARDPSIDICTVRTMEVLQAEAEDAPLDETGLQEVEQTKAFWTASMKSTYKMTLPQEYIEAHTNAAGVSSTAPAPGANGPPRTNSIPSATQASSHYVPGTQPSLLLSRPPQMGSSLAARDIRNGSTAGPSKGPSLAGLPITRENG
jgi:SNF2 family DNA or RNA helicase